MELKLPRRVFTTSTTTSPSSIYYPAFFFYLRANALKTLAVQTVPQRVAVNGVGDGVYSGSIMVVVPHMGSGAGQHVGMG